MSGLVLTRKPLLDDIARWLGPDAATTVVVTSDGVSLPGEAAFRHVHRVPDYGAPEVGTQVVEIARHFGTTRIGSLNEVDVLRAAAARRLLGLPGQDLACAVAFRDKHVMKSLAAAAGVPVAAMRRATDVPAAVAAARELGYPVVVKPVDGGGSVGVRVLARSEDWSGVTDPGPLLVEELVDEVEFFIVDGLMCYGRATLQVPLRMGSGNFTYANAGAPVAGYSVPVTGELHHELSAFTDRVLGALPAVAEETAFHLEVFRDSTGRLVLCEVASRAGGMGHAPTFRAATGVELNGASLLGQLGRPRRAAGPERVGEAGFAGFPRRGGLLHRHPARLAHPLVTSYRAVATAGERYERSRWVGDDAASVLVRAPVGTSMREVMDDVISEYHEGTRWT